MAKYQGRRVNIGVCKEAVRGAGGTPTRWIPKIDYTLFDKANKATSEESFSNIAGFGGQEIVTQKHSEGELAGEINVKGFPLLMYATFGSISSAAQNSDYKHTFTVNQSNQHQSLCFTTKEPNGDRKYRNAMIDSMEITINPEEIVKFSCGLKSKVGVDASEVASYETADYKFVGRDLEFKVANDTSSLGAASALSTKEITVTIQKNTEFDLVNGTLEPEEIHNKQMTIEGSITLNYEDTTWRDYMLNGTYKAMGIKLTNTRDTMGSENPELYIELPRVAFSEWEREIANDDIATQTLNFKGLFDLATGKVFSSVYIVNNVASY